MAEYRSRKQIDANSVDLEVFRVIGQIERFAADFRDDDALRMAHTIASMRARIRKHMHQKDREATA